ncbi:hypothetical protein C1878_07820 [Gordonibacter sp. 28C]|uniref:hypothetical protein n=1 Tax=Gordonibacter sp. 28C TaxID=2078569 RepID=UPI000DF83BB2|nr:hypothetical protein [Gordonibacter sp. 28C]RDB62234.1 hypothetical protein C1878_07820 [Gordonibacter sp. 28C]
MRNREWVYAAIAVASFVLMAGSLVLTYMNAGEGQPELGEFVPAILFGALFLVNLVLAKQNKRR